ncbi:MAG: glutathione transferase [Myxococcaceae bacterium]
MADLRLSVDAFWTSPYAFSAFVALKEKGLAFEVDEVALHRREHQHPEALAASLTGRVPVLSHRGWTLSESSAIDEYLEDTFPHPGHPRLFPEDVRERARARQLMAWVRSDLMPIRAERPTTTLFYGDMEFQPLSTAAQGSAARLLAVADALITPGRSTLFSTFCIADADFALMLLRLLWNAHPAPKKVRTYVEAQWARPSVRAWVEHPRAPYVAY